MTRRIGWAVLAGVWASLAVTLHASAQPFPLFIAAAAGIEAIRQPGSRRALLMMGVVATAIPAIVFLTRLAALDWSLTAFMDTVVFPRSHSRWLNPVFSLRELFVKAFDMHLIYSDEHPLLDPALLVLVPLGLGLVLRRFWTRSHSLMLLLIGISLLPAILSPYPEPRRMINLMIPLFLVAGFAWDALAEPLGRLRGLASVVLFCGILAAQTALHFGGMVQNETSRFYQQVAAGRMALGLFRERAILVPNDLVIDAFYTHLDLDRFVPELDEGMISLPFDDIPAVLADRDDLPGPPIIILPCEPGYEELLVCLPGAVVREHFIPAATPRMEDTILLIASFP